MSTTGSIFQDEDEQQENPFAEFTDEQPVEAVVEDVSETPTSTYTQEDSFDTEISEAERRFNKAALYKQWVSGRLFGDNDSPEVLEVEKEFKDFARLQLKKLIGLEQDKPSVSSEFTPEEVTVLKTLAAQVLKKPALIKPAEKPVVKKPPVLQPRPAAPKVEKPVVVPKPVPQQTKPTVTIPAKPQAKPPVQQPVGSKVPANESVIKEGGKTYKIHHIQITANEYGPGPAGIINGMKPNSVMKLMGVQIYKDPNGTLFKIVKKDDTPKPMPENRVPFPDTQQMEDVTQRMSERAVNSSANRLGRGMGIM